MPELISLYPEPEALLQAFETLSRLILAAIGPGEQRQAWRAIQFILIDFGYVPNAAGSIATDATSTGRGTQAMLSGVLASMESGPT